MNSDEIRELQGMIKNCDPNRPLHAGDPLYEPLDEGAPVRGSDGRSCIDDLAQTIVRAEATEATCQLFAGFPGTGKTTELRRLKDRLEKDRVVPTHVVLMDALDFLDVYAPISITDILRMLAFSLDRAAAEEEAIAEGRDPDTAETSYLRRLFDFVARTDVQLKSMGFDQYGAKLMLEIKDNPNFRQRIEDALALRFQQFAEEARDMMADAVLRLRKVTHAGRVVVILDGLEQLTHLREEDRAKVEGAVETVFVQHASWLRLPAVHVIYTFPLWLRFRAPMLGALYDSEPRILPMVKISEQEGAAPYPAGLTKLRALVGRRIDLRRVFGGDHDRVAPLIAASGGYPRDLLRMIRDLLRAAPALPVTPTDVERVIARIGESYARVIRTPDIELLLEVARTHALPEGDDARLADFGRLLSRWLVLAYRNGTEWYDLHPLVREAPVVKLRLAAQQE